MKFKKFAHCLMTGVMLTCLTNLTVQAAETTFHSDGLDYPVDSFFDVFVQVDLPPLPLPHFDGPLHMYNSSGLDLIGQMEIIDTEIVQLNLVGNGGMMIRESPTLTSFFNPGSEPFYVHSFFDVFTELSLDGGQTWYPSQGSTRFSTPDSGATALLLPLGLLGAYGFRRYCVAN